ncbi:hypothetical protein BZA77DRAFT_355616 [Pyronema omphalodes]|nr:hypothetical protein BZA77DRAFT_355616 [Pyronema omphalodes]
MSNEYDILGQYLLDTFVRAAATDAAPEGTLMTAPSTPTAEPVVRPPIAAQKRYVITLKFGKLKGKFAQLDKAAQRRAESRAESERRVRALGECTPKNYKRWVETQTTRELKVSLRERKLLQTGRKDDMVDRLINAIEAEYGVV